MRQPTIVKVDLNKTNIDQCMCTDCPVQAKSQCVKIKEAAMNETFKKNPLQGQDIPSMYCSTGIAACKDFDFSLECICKTCAVFDFYNLGKGKLINYFCQKGAAG